MFPLLSERYCLEFIEEAEATKAWSNGEEKDSRLQGGYEPVPTRDIHFNQMDYKKAFRLLLLNFVAPVANFHYTGYYMKADVNLDFIVKYQPEGQPYLRPHSDASSVTIVVALNRHGIDFEGGGTRFIRQNCTVHKFVVSSFIFFDIHLRLQRDRNVVPASRSHHASTRRLADNKGDAIHSGVVHRSVIPLHACISFLHFI